MALPLLGPVAIDIMRQLGAPAPRGPALVNARTAAAGNVPEQQRLAVQERRDMVREAVADRRPIDAFALGAMVPMEQAAKAVMSIPGVGPVAESILKRFNLYEGSRSGFAPERITENLAAPFSGAMQGMLGK